MNNSDMLSKEYRAWRIPEGDLLDKSPNRISARTYITNMSHAIFSLFREQEITAKKRKEKPVVLFYFLLREREEL